MGLVPKPVFMIVEKLDGSSPPLTANGENAAVSPLNEPSAFHIGELLSYGVMAT
jgi:hypothetical protein